MNCDFMILMGCFANFVKTERSLGKKYGNQTAKSQWNTALPWFFRYYVYIYIHIYIIENNLYKIDKYNIYISRCTHGYIRMHACKNIYAYMFQ